MIFTLTQIQIKNDNFNFRLSDTIFAKKINVFNSKYRHNNLMMNLNEIIFNSFSFNEAKK